MLSITVNVGFDERDNSITDGDVSLRDAILIAPAGETIDFAPSLNDGRINLLPEFGEIAFAKTLTIDASMLPAGITIDASGADPTPDSTFEDGDPFNDGDGIRIFNITGGGSTLVTLKSLKLTGGDVNGAGGAIQSSASLTLQECVITGNHAAGIGGGLSASVTNGAITIDKSTFGFNSSSGSNSDGAGAFLYVTGSSLTIRDTTVTGNRALDVEANVGGIGIDARTSSHVEIDGLQVIGNHADDDIGGLYISNWDSEVTLKNCTVSGNTAGHTGGAVEAAAGVWLRTNAGASPTNPNITTIENSTISGNVILPSSGPPDSDNVWGGGLYIQSLPNSTTYIRNSTISGNQAQGSGGGIMIARYGGGTGATVSIQHSTITDNRADSDGDGQGIGGGIHVGATSTTVTLDHTIVAGNFKGPESNPIGNDIAGSLTIGWSLIGDNTGATITQAPGTTNYVGTGTMPIDPKLGPLVYNGGPVFLNGSRMLTHALLPDSPAVNAGDPSIEFSPTEFDQRGAPWSRVYPTTNGRIDIGALEWQANPLQFDYNFNGVLDVADYIVWRDTLGSETDLRANGDGDGDIDASDYMLWKMAYGITTQSLLGDASGNGAVDIADYYIWASTYGSNTDLRADCNEDGVVDDADFEIWFDTFGSTLEIAQFGLLSSYFDPDAPPAVVGFALSLPGDKTVDFAGKVGSGEQIRSAPLIVANTLSITFSQDVVVTQNDLEVTNLAGASPNILDFAYDSASQTATWTFTSALADGQFLVRLSDSVENLDGQALDGEFFNPMRLSDAGTAFFPSGDGDEGGEFRFRFTILVGDLNHDNIDGATNYQNWQSTEPGMIIVSTTADDYDGDLSFGDVSLREAVNYANSATEPTTIQLPAGRYYLTRTGTESTTNTDFNDLDILGNVTIIGAGPGATIIDPQFGSWQMEPHRGFDISGSGRRLNLSRVTLAGSMLSYYSSGGAAYVSNQGALELKDSAVVFNGQYSTAVYGVGIRSSGGDVTIERTVFTNNNGYDGSAIFASTQGSYNGSLTIGESIFALNSNTYSGGTPNVKVIGAVAKTNLGNNLFDNATGGFFDAVAGSGDYQGTPHYVVTTVLDTFDHVDDNESLSIREAVDLANQASGLDEIWIPAWNFVLTRDRGTNVTDTDVSYGDIDVTDSLIARGVSGLTNISWKAGVVDKVFELVGDSNNDGTVSSADYTLWQDQNGCSGAWEQFSADADDDGDVDEDDYDIWAQYYGHTLELFDMPS